MIFKLVPFLALILALFIGVHSILYHFIVRFFFVTGLAAKISLVSILAFLSVSFMASFFLLHWYPNKITSCFYIFAASWTGLMINLVVAAGSSWLCFHTLRLLRFTPNPKTISIVFLGCALLYSLYGFWNAMNPKVKRLRLEVKNLPAEWRGKTIVQLSDVHLGRIYSAGFLEKVIKKVNAANPELIVITGDLFDGLNRNLDPFAGLLNKLRAKGGIFFVTGNHETYIGLDRVLEVLDKTGITVLNNRIVDLNGLRLIGIAYPGLRNTRDVQNLIDSIGEQPWAKPTVLLFHTPTNIAERVETHDHRHFNTYWAPDTSFTLSKKIGVNLQLSGHTHAGQIFPFGSLTKRIYKGYHYGFHTDGDFSLYITSGVGTWGPPMRTGTSPEIVVITLR